MIYPMANVLYYLGAGASANALPTVNEMTERFGLFFLMAHYHYNQQNPNSNIDINTELIKAIGALYFILKGKRSIDTFAKELWLRNKNDVSNPQRVKTFKNILALYFVWEERKKEEGFINIDNPRDTLHSYVSSSSQETFVYIVRGNNRLESFGSNDKDHYPIKEEFEEIMKKFDDLINKKKKTDDRYINFLNYVLEQGEEYPSFPSNKIKIVSWNYDNQFELACDSMRMGSIYEKEIKPNLLPVNGKFKRHGHYSFIGVLQNYRESDDGIQFAWENANPNYDEFLKEFDNREEKHIVVIGYSFPFANREIDKLILKRIIRGWDEDASNRRYYRPAINIYIQAGSQKDYEDIKERMISLASIDIGAADIKITRDEDLDNFFIPNAL